MMCVKVNECTLTVLLRQPEMMVSSEISTQLTSLLCACLWHTRRSPVAASQQHRLPSLEQKQHCEGNITLQRLSTGTRGDHMSQPPSSTDCHTWNRNNTVKEISTYRDYQLAHEAITCRSLPAAQTAIPGTETTL